MSTEDNINLDPCEADRESKLLARVYALILSWPDPEEAKTAGSEHFGEDAEPAEGSASPLSEDAS